MKPKHILFGLLALIGASCTNDEMNEVAALKQNGIQVTAGLTANTRVNFEQDGTVTHALWEEGDQITLYAPSQGYLPYQVSTLSEDATSATFTSVYDALQNTDETIYAAYTPDMAPDIVDGTAVLPNTDMLTGEHPLPFAYAISKVDDGKLNLSFEHVFAYLKLTLNAETVAGSTNKSVAVIGVSTTSDEPLANVYGYFNIPEQEYVIEKGSNHMYFTLEEAFTATGTAEKSVYIPILPQPAGETITINIFGDYEAADTLFTESKEVPSTGFVAGRAYTYSPKSSITRVGNTVTLTEAGTLSQAISEEEKYAIKELKIIGPLNGDDIRLIREMAGVDVYGNATEGVLTHLDISEARIVEGGEAYYNDYCYTLNDIVGNYMFYETILEQVLLPSTTISIEHASFAKCSFLSSIDIPEGVTSLGTHAFSDCVSLSSIEIPNSVTLIGNYAFMDCSTLTSIDIPNGVTSIGDYAFARCQSLTSIDIPNGVTSIGDYAFSESPSLVVITIPDSVISIGEGAFYFCTSLSSINIPDAVTRINTRTFTECSALTSISIPDGVTSIGEQAFAGCSSLPSIVIPSAVASIGLYAFGTCSSLSEVTCNATTPPTLGSDAFANIASPATLYVPASTYDTYMASDWANYFTTIDGGSYANGIVTLTTAGDLPYLISESEKYSISSLKVIGPINGTDIRFIREMAGVGVEGWSTTSGQLVDLDMSEAMIVEGGDYYLDHFTAEMAMGPLYTSSNEIGEYMFGWVEGNSTILEKVLLPNTVTCIGGGAFEDCWNLTSINIPDSVKTIRWLAFYGCSNIETITIPSSVVNIENQAFLWCSSLSEVTCLATTPPVLDDGVFDRISSSATLIVPAGSAAAYSASDWAQYFTTIEEK